jgi:hypothetical protein
MWGMPEPVIVWAVRLGQDLSESKGTLSLDDAFLTFRHKRGVHDDEIPLSAIRRVRRGLGSPVLIVEYEREGDRASVAFFFAQPPPLNPDTAGFRKVKERRENLGVLLAQNTDLRSRVREWRRAVREAARRAGA